MCHDKLHWLLNGDDASHNPQECKRLAGVWLSSQQPAQAPALRALGRLHHHLPALWEPHRTCIPPRLLGSACTMPKDPRAEVWTALERAPMESSVPKARHAGTNVNFQVH